MKDITRQEFMTKLYMVENQDDLGLKEVEKFISDVIERNVMQTFSGVFIKKFEKVEISLIKFGSDRENNRGGDNVVVNVDSRLIDKLKESSILSKYQIEFKETSGVSSQSKDLLITFITTNKY